MTPSAVKKNDENIENKSMNKNISTPMHSYNGTTTAIIFELLDIFLCSMLEGYF